MLYIHFWKCHVMDGILLLHEDVQDQGDTEHERVQQRQFSSLSNSTLHQ